MKPVLDATCGSRMMWFNHNNPLAVYVDRRDFEKTKIWESKDGTSVKYCEVKPDMVADFTALPFDDNTFWHVVFDPPHLTRLGETSWLSVKYGKLPTDWRPVIRGGVRECMRVLKPNGTLIFKWNETDIKVSDIIKAIGIEPLYGTRSGKHNNTIWMAFIKTEEMEDGEHLRNEQEGEKMTLSEAVKTIKDYCSKTVCTNCVYSEDGKFWKVCGLMIHIPVDWKEPQETNIKKEEEE